jgi:starvation-inducible outer membrane lipoprotein
MKLKSIRVKQILLIISLSLLTGCTSSSKVFSSEHKNAHIETCEPPQHELDSLKFDNKMEQGGKVVNALMLRNQYNKEEKHLDQKIKVLEMKLMECERGK